MQFIKMAKYTKIFLCYFYWYSIYVTLLSNYGIVARQLPNETEKKCKYDWKHIIVWIPIEKHYNTKENVSYFYIE